MNDKKAYHVLFHAMTDAINTLYKSKLVTMEMDNGIKALKEAQCKTEEMYINKGEGHTGRR